MKSIYRVGDKVVYKNPDGTMMFSARIVEIRPMLDQHGQESEELTVQNRRGARNTITSAQIIEEVTKKTWENDEKKHLKGILVNNTAKFKSDLDRAMMTWDDEAPGADPIQHEDAGTW